MANLPHHLAKWSFVTERLHVARLVVENGDDTGTSYLLAAPRISIGRSPDNEIQLMGKRTSRVHAEILCSNHHYVLKDLGSKNGTFLNDQLLESQQALRNGDRILIGDSVLRFEEDSIEAQDNSGFRVRLVPDGNWGHEEESIEAGQAAVSATPSTPHFGDESGTAKRLQVLLQLADAIRSCHEITPLMERVADLVFTLLQPDRAFIMVLDETTHLLVPCVSRFQSGLQQEEVSISRTIVDRTIQEKMSLVVSDALADERFDPSDSIVIQKIRSAIVAPLVFQDTVYGVLYFDTRHRTSAYDRRELELATGIANQTAMALSNISMQKRMIDQRTLEREMQIAREIQTRLLPRSMPQIENYDCSAMSVPAKHVGGDYFDFIPLPEGKLGIAIADVSGKGVPAAILTASVRSALQVEVRGGHDLVEVMNHLNEMVYRDTESNMFVTMVYAMLDPKTGELEYANAGHPYPLLFSSDGNLTELVQGGCFLGIGERMPYLSARAILPPGSILLLYSDGVTDTQANDGNIYGRKRLIATVRNQVGSSSEQIRAAIVKDTADFQGSAEQFDDFTLVVIRRLS